MKTRFAMDLGGVGPEGRKVSSHDGLCMRHAPAFAEPQRGSYDTHRHYNVEVESTCRLAGLYILANDFA